MQSLRVTTFNPILAAIAVLAVIFLTLLGSHMDMDRSGGDLMGSGCAFMVGAEQACHMSHEEHLATWQHALTALPNTNAPVLLMIAAFLWSLILLSGSVSRFSGGQATLRTLRATGPTDPPPPLREAFSQGILNPKLYNTVV